MKKIKLTENQLKDVINTVVSEQLKITSGGSQNNMITSCSELGVKYAGYCDTMAKKPIKSCAEMGIKTPGFCYVDTKQPVPGIKQSTNTIKEQSLAAMMSGGSGPTWWEEFGCIMDGIDGIRKAQGDQGTLFIIPKNGKEYALVNTIHNKPDPELVKKIQSVNPNIKRFGKAINLKDRNEISVYYCHGPIRGGIRVVGVNDTIDPPRQSKPAAQPASNTPSGNPAPINEEVSKIKKMMRVIK